MTNPSITSRVIADLGIDALRAFFISLSIQLIALSRIGHVASCVAVVSRLEV